MLTVIGLCEKCKKEQEIYLDFAKGERVPLSHIWYKCECGNVVKLKRNDLNGESFI